MWFLVLWSQTLGFWKSGPLPKLWKGVIFAPLPSHLHILGDAFWAHRWRPTCSSPPPPPRAIWTGTRFGWLCASRVHRDAQKWRPGALKEGTGVIWVAFLVCFQCLFRQRWCSWKCTFYRGKTHILVRDTAMVELFFVFLPGLSDFTCTFPFRVDFLDAFGSFWLSNGSCLAALGEESFSSFCSASACICQCGAKSVPRCARWSPRAPKWLQMGPKSD